MGEVPAVLKLKQKDGAVVLILGRRESGKSVLAYRLAQIVGRTTYAVSPEQKPPEWVHELKLEEISELPPPESTLIMDDLPVYMSSHSYQDAGVRVVEQIIPVVRHRRKLLLIFSSQAASLSDRYVMDADLIFLKKPNLLYADLERPAVAKFYKSIMPIFNQMNDAQAKRHAYLLSSDWKGLVSINLP